MSIPHRISTGMRPEEAGFVDNFSGTLAHELAHGGSTSSMTRPGGLFFDDNYGHHMFYEPWYEKFGWTWDRINGKTIFSTKYPEKCIGGGAGYAATRPEEDICDSVAAYILNPQALDSGRRQFIQERIAEYRKIHLIPSKVN